MSAPDHNLAPGSGPTGSDGDTGRGGYNNIVHPSIIKGSDAIAWLVNNGYKTATAAAKLDRDSTAVNVLPTNAVEGAALLLPGVKPQSRRLHHYLVAELPWCEGLRGFSLAATSAQTLDSISSAAMRIDLANVDESFEMGKRVSELRGMGLVILTHTLREEWNPHHREGGDQPVKVRQISVYELLSRVTKVSKPEMRLVNPLAFALAERGESALRVQKSLVMRRADAQLVNLTLCHQRNQQQWLELQGRGSARTDRGMGA